MNFIVTVKKLTEYLNNNSDVAIVDVRYQLDDPSAGKKAYEKAHIPQAIYFDLEGDLSDIPRKHGGNHPLPNANVLAEKLGEAGIDKDTTVVVYDKGNDMFAPRFWWLLRFLGHEDVYILDGGYEAWIKAGQPVTAEISTKVSKKFQPNVQSNEIVDIHRIKENIINKEAILIDSRSSERYLGISEPLYTKAGHIPGAKNYFWMEVLDENGRWKSKEELEKQFSKLNKEQEIIVSCGSGVSATPNIIALKMIGFKNVKLYPGSYSDWISYENNPVETKDETND
ncbi:sulfurtransferase [Ornithinibacillus halotolerans]|uniref:Thiosulfate sulfurtransferase n=1 Tax=Ornithinibacillus halotolerans TaxID=1274357 RepID=A0A916S587_9BACI|nr:sulfurtransferase [Ornithinibacillus halotolerans]GGA84858.1 thiosulfate sulfurtransferase [Ornithinibacillus halotolerans]